jgi:hypothetical protein
MLVGNRLYHPTIHMGRDTGRKDAMLDEECLVPNVGLQPAVVWSSRICPAAGNDSPFGSLRASRAVRNYHNLL